MKLRRKIGLGISLGMAVSVIGANFLVFTNSRSEIQQSITANQSEIVHQGVNSIDRLMYERYLDIQVIATAPSLEDLLTDRSQDKASSVRRLKEQTLLSGPWDILFAINKNGTIITSSDPKLPKATSITGQPNNQAAYQAAMEGKIYVSDLVTSDDTDQPTVLFAAPVRDNNIPTRPIIGVVIGNLSWLSISSILHHVQHGSIVNLYTEAGVLISTNQTTSEKLFTKDEEDLPLIRQAISSRHESSGVIKGIGNSPTYLVSVSPTLGYLDYKGNSWALLIETPVRTIFAPATRIAISSIIFITLISILTFILFSLLLKFIVIDPIASLTKLARAIATGDLSQRWSAMKSNDEIGELGQTFNEMSGRLQVAQTNLQAQIDTKTQQLRQKVEDTERLNQTMVGRELRMIELKKQVKTLEQELKK